ncbi:MAG: hypothetical protein AB1405_04185 [Bdellovibrionota bacterium]
MGLLDSLGFGFTEKMGGTFTGKAEGIPASGNFHFLFEVDSDDVTDAIRKIVGRAVGRVTMDGVAENIPAEGTLEISPLWKRRIRYTFTFSGKDGKKYKFDGWKSINPLKMVSSWTTLPGKVYDEKGAVVAEAITYFDKRNDFPDLFRSFRTRPLRQPAI